MRPKIIFRPCLERTFKYLLFYVTSTITNKFAKRVTKMKFEDEEWDDIKTQSFALITLTNNRVKILEKVGYAIDSEGFIIDSKTKRRVKAETDRKPINIKKDKKFALIAGSHIFVRNVVDYSRYLEEKGRLPKIEAEKEKKG